jgi:hypothetical protein
MFVQRERCCLESTNHYTIVTLSVYYPLFDKLPVFELIGIS